MKMKPYLQLIDTHTDGSRNDVTPLFADAECFGQLIDDMTAPFVGGRRPRLPLNYDKSAPFQDIQVDCVACIDALGFILGTAIAQRLGVGIIPIRKGDKLPVRTISEEFRDYSGDIKRLEIRKDALLPQTRVLIVDEWIETGAQIKATAKLIEAQGGIIVGIATISMDVNDKTSAISKKYDVHTVWEG